MLKRELKYPSLDRLTEVLEYNSDTGIFTWKVNKHRVKAGDIAGFKNKEGYICIKIDGYQCLAHRLAWLYVYGRMPTEIDHINHKREDNSIENIREVTRSENLKNLSSRANSIHPGVSKHGKKFRARVSQKHIGVFASVEEAKRARSDALALMGYHRNHQ